MGLKRYTGSADNTITNAFKEGLTIRATGSNMGQSDVLEIFSVAGRNPLSSSDDIGSQELSRALIKFPITTVSTDRTAGTIPASGSVNFYLRMFNSTHARTVPKQFTLSVFALSRSWQEGLGISMFDTNYTDSTNGNTGSNWMSASNLAKWTHVGGDWLTQSNQWDASGVPPSYKQLFESGLENLEIDITGIVEHWMAGDLGNNGVGIMLTSSQEAYYSIASAQATADEYTLDITGGVASNYYVKRFFARSSQYYYKRPLLEARWDSTKRDNRGSFYYSSSLAPAADNMNTIYLYNYVRGRLRDIPDLGEDNRVYVSLFSGSSDNLYPSGAALVLSPDNSGYVRSADPTVVTGGAVSTGIYSASFAFTGSPSVMTVYDVWFTGSGTATDQVTSSATQYFTGTITPITTGSVQESVSHVRAPVYFINITNLRNKYTTKETARFNLYVRNKNWSPTIYTKANANVPATSIVSASYRVIRTLDAYEAIEHGTSSNNCTGLSFDKSGNYFDLDMSMLEGGYEYALKFAFYDPELSIWNEQDKSFKFRVIANEY